MCEYYEVREVSLYQIGGRKAERDLQAKRKMVATSV